jgi:hypothetical protein
MPARRAQVAKIRAQIEQQATSCAERDNEIGGE